MKSLLTEHDVAEILGVKVSTLRTWRRRGEGPPWHKLGQYRRSPVRYFPAELQEWLDGTRGAEERADERVDERE